MNKSIGQLLIVGIAGEALTNEEKSFIIENNIGGVILMGRNTKEPKQVHALCSEIQSLRYKMIDKAPLFIGVDMEGGTVHRLKEPFTQWPALKKVGDLDNSTVTYHFANKMATELKAIGFNLDFAPCVDTLTNPNNKAIGSRALSHDARMVEKHASALVRGYIKAGIISCAKHFPGHGNTLVDSHDDLPVEDADLARLQEVELLPFKKAIKSRVDFLMMAHLMFPKIDPENPVTFSEFFIQKLVRQELRYRGLIISDDLDMKAMTKKWERDQIAVKAVQAGIEILLYCNDPSSPPMAIEGLMGAIAQGQIDKAYVESVKKKILDFKKDRLAQSDPIPFEQAAKIIGHPDHLKFAAAVNKGELPQGLMPE